MGMTATINYEPGKAFHTQRVCDRKAVRDWEKEQRAKRAKRAKGVARARRRRRPSCGWTGAATIALVACAAWLCS